MSYSLLRETFPVARVPHQCIWCGEWIETGTKYRHERSVYDGHMQDHKWHLGCDKGFKVELDAGMDQEFIPYSNERLELPAGVTPTVPNGPKATHEARRWCKGDGEWTTWQPVPPDKLAERRADPTFEVRPITLGVTKGKTNG